MIKIEIDGKSVTAEAGSMIIKVADDVGIPIPRFCYHRKLSIAANCRMCLVQVEKSPKPLPACATPIAEGMKIWTTSPQAVDAQRSVMEFLLINHPLDCPICDQGGECELQDVSMQYGNDISRFTESKRVVEDHNLGPLIATDLTRCIQCTRCVRFGMEISGERELGAVDRGENLRIETFMHQHVNSEVSGNVIDLCPVGALTSKPFRFRARAWELTEFAAISPHDCVGSNLNLHVLHKQVMRVVAKDAENINEAWLSDRDRFSYQALTQADRLRKPMLHRQDKWSIVSWIESLKYALAGIKLVIDTYGADQVGILVTPSATTEEYYLLQQFARGLGIANIDHRLRQQDFSEQQYADLFPNLGMEIKDLSQVDSFLLVGSHLHKEQPIIGLKVRKLVLNGGKVCVINPLEFHFNFDLHAQDVTGVDLIKSLAGVAKELINLTDKPEFLAEKKLLAAITVSAAQQQIAQALLTGSKRSILFGQLALMHPQASNLISLGKLIAKLIDGTFGVLSDGANAAGAWLAGCVPHRLPGGEPLANPGLDAMQMLQKPLRGYILYGVEPEFDSILGKQSIQTLQQADFVVALSAFQSNSLMDIADVILPIAPFAENSGSMINVEGTWQQTTAAVEPLGESRGGWKILRVLGDLANLPDFEYLDLDSVSRKMANFYNPKAKLPASSYSIISSFTAQESIELLRIAPVPLYAVDALTRRAHALQNTKDAENSPTVQMNDKTAKRLKVFDLKIVTVKSKYGKTLLPLAINNNILDNCVLIYQALPQTIDLGAPYAAIEVHP